MIAVKDGTKWRMAVKDVMEPAKSAGIQKHDIFYGRGHGGSTMPPI